MRKFARTLSRGAAVAGAAALATGVQAMTNNLTSINATTASIDSAADGGLNVGLGLITVGFIVGGLMWGLRASFKKRPT